MTFSPKSRPRWPLRVALVLAVGWGIWVYYGLKPHPLVTRSALRNYKASVAEYSADAPPPKHNITTTSYVVWKDLPPDLKTILGSLEKRWDYLSANQRRSVLVAANRYSSMTEEQQIRFNSRLVEWTRLTGKERRALRDGYKALKSLPPEQQDNAKKSWFEDHVEPSAVGNRV